MEHDFWHKKWSDGKIGFHQAEINPYLQSYWQRMGLEGDGKVFVPLCGKSSDMLWLREQGHEVLGVELNASACEAFFSENDAEPVKVEGGDFTSYSIDGRNISKRDDLFVVDRHHTISRLETDRVLIVYRSRESRGTRRKHLPDRRRHDPQSDREHKDEQQRGGDDVDDHSGADDHESFGDRTVLV